MAATATTLAADLGVHKGDVDVLLELLDEHSPELSNQLAAFLRRVFDPHGERTAPRGLYRPGAGPRPHRTFGLGQHLVGGRSVHEQHVDEVGRGHPACGGDAL